MPSILGWLAGALLVSVSILLTNHWQIVPMEPHGTLPQVYRLNRWTGQIEVCIPSAGAFPVVGTFVGAEMYCAMPVVYATRTPEEPETQK